MARKCAFTMLSQLAIFAPGQAETPEQRRPLPLMRVAVIVAAGAPPQHVTTVVVDGEKPNLTRTLTVVEILNNKQSGN